ncbi:uncharacterized protein LOC113555578 isoform X1 [Rhopalosiphum maidis]|uniref:uncharacterized protein LOC113555578 isoform X1 n=1 Tax=Rhopalosiphum maidis TaxID=43146 RepID=UPI000EFE23BA|nr:uncharacterized protein LOC113555578 isoform X1 [Rhopalosiphum maidis]
MPYEPLVLLHRLAPEDVNHLIRQNPPPPTITNQPHMGNFVSNRNAHTFQNNEGINTQSLEKDIVVNNSNLPLENKQKLTCTRSSPKLRVLKSNLNGVNNDKLEKAKFSKEQKSTNSLKGELSFAEKSKLLSTDIFKKELVVVIDNCFDDVIREMVNSTAQHPKTRNPTNSTVATNSNTTSNNSVASTRDSAVGKEHITDDTIMITTTKSPLSTITPAIEVLDKKTKDISLNGQQHIAADEHDKQINCDKIHYDSSGLSLRTRTISSTAIPTLLHHTTVSGSNSAQPNCSTSSVTTPAPRPRGRPPRRKNLKRIADRKAQQQAASKLSEESEVCDLTTSVTEVESAAIGLERLQQQQKSLNECDSIEIFDDDEENSEKIVTYIKAVTDNTHSVLSPEVDKDEDCIIVEIPFKKKSNNRKRKQSDIGETIAEKRLFISDDSKDLLVEKNILEKSSLPDKSDSDLVKYGFLAGCNIFEPYRQYTDLKSSSSNCHSILYGRTYWPTSWEYSAASLTGHVQKKTSKEALRKIRLISGGATSKTNNSLVSTSLKTNSTIKKYQTSILQRRGSACKSTAIAPVEVSGGTRHPSTSAIIVKRQKGRPPGRKNKILQAVIKSNSPRKSPRQHASTLAAILSSKAGNHDKVGNQQPDKLEADVEIDKNSLDMDVPCLLKMSVPNYEHMSGFRHHRHRRQLDNKRIIKRRRRRRSTTPPPPKLCAQQPAPQRISLNTAIDQERVKLRTKHVDVVRRRARDERLRASFVCQQLHKVQEIAEQNRRKIAQEVIQTNDENKEDYQFSSNAIILPFESDQDQIWSQITDSNREPDNMCLQIMYEQTADKRFLYTNLTDETLQMYYQQRELALTERLTSNYCGETLSSDIGTDMISTSNKRKKKRPNMTGWPKEKRRKIIATSSINTIVDDLNDDSDAERDDIAKRRRAAAAEQQRLRRQRIKLEQQQLLKEKSKVKVRATSPKRRGRRPGRPRRPGPIKKNKTAIYRRNNSVSSNGTTASSNTSSNTTIKVKKVRKPRKQRTPAQNKTAATVSVTTDTPNTVVKRRCGRPVGSIGRRQRLKLEMLQQNCQNQTSSSEQQKENVVQQQSSTGKLKCVISTRNNRMKLLSTSSRSPSAASSQKKTMITSKTKKSTAAYNLTSSCLTSLPSSQVTVVGKITRTTTKRRRLQQHQQTATATVTWDVGRPKRYHSTNHSRNASSVVVEEDCCFVGSQPFEQHCPGGGGGLSHNTVLENHDHQKENTVHGGL